MACCAPSAQALHHSLTQGAASSSISSIAVALLLPVPWHNTERSQRFAKTTTRCQRKGKHQCSQTKKVQLSARLVLEKSRVLSILVSRPAGPGYPTQGYTTVFIIIGVLIAMCMVLAFPVHMCISHHREQVGCRMMPEACNRMSTKPQLPLQHRLRGFRQLSAAIAMELRRTAADPCSQSSCVPSQRTDNASALARVLFIVEQPDGYSTALALTEAKLLA